jgi:hypothetical protein
MIPTLPNPREARCGRSARRLSVVRRILWGRQVEHSSEHISVSFVRCLAFKCSEWTDEVAKLLTV